MDNFQFTPPPHGFNWRMLFGMLLYTACLVAVASVIAGLM